MVDRLLASHPRAVLSGWVVAVFGAVLWSWAGGPLPWLLGPMVAYGLARGLGVPLREWGWGRALGQCVIGVGLGTRFTPEVVAGLAERWPWLLTLAVLALLPAPLGMWAYRRWGGLDRIGSWLCALPGGASEMAVLAERHGVPAAPVALTQGLRVALVVSLVPWSLLWLPGELAPVGALRSAPGGTVLAWQAGLFTLAWALLIAWPTAALHRRRWPNVWMMLPLLATAVLMSVLPAWTAHRPLGLALTVPAVALDAAQLLLGITLGSKLDAQAWRQAPRLTAVATGVVLTSVGLCGLVAWCAAAVLPGGPAPWLTHYLALAPGGMAEMALLARQSGAFLPEVIATHVLRLMLVLALAPGLLRGVASRSPSGPLPPATPP